MKDIVRGFMEIFELLNINGEKSGVNLTAQELKEKGIPKGLYLSVVGIVIVNDDNKVLMQKRSKTKRTNPLKWGICGGKVNKNETFLEASIREVKEEIGVTLNENELNYVETNTVGDAKFTIFYVKRNVKIEDCVIQESELDELKYFDINEIEQLENEGVEWLESIKEIIK